MQWLELKIDAAPAGLEPVSALLEDLGITGLVIDDEGDFQDFLEHNHAYWDYVDDQLMQEKKGLCRITFYLEDSPDGYNTLARVRMALSRVKQEHPEYGRLLLTMENMEDADWENNWKQFYKPMEIGDRLIVIPEWESTGVPEGRVALRLNPGLTFGTGSHATTRLCLTALEKHVRGGETVLDLGCGSGILSIAALLLGADRAVACDMHPDYLSTAAAEELAAKRGIPLLRVQHHHAHMVSCMADNGLEGECLGLIWDGTGYGTDGATWGGELLAGGARGFERLGSIRPIPLPGGDLAALEIRRIAEALRFESGLAGEDTLLRRMLERGVSCPRSSGMGRLFDGVCALAGIRAESSYEGQGAVLLEAAADEAESGEYDLAFEDNVFDWRPMIRQIAALGEAPGTVAAKFMNTLVSMVAAQCRAAAEQTGLRRVVLSGGVFQNMYLMERLPRALKAAGLEVYTHSRVSPNDEGVALGQLMILEASRVVKRFQSIWVAFFRR